LSFSAASCLVWAGSFLANKPTDRRASLGRHGKDEQSSSHRSYGESVRQACQANGNGRLDVPVEIGCLCWHVRSEVLVSRSVWRSKRRSETRSFGERVLFAVCVCVSCFPTATSGVPGDSAPSVRWPPASLLRIEWCDCFASLRNQHVRVGRSTTSLPPVKPGAPAPSTPVRAIPANDEWPCRPAPS
jgi:hypothetical protein